MNGRVAAGSSGKAYVRRIARTCRYINGPGVRERCVGSRVGDGHSKTSSVVTHLHIEYVRQMQIYARTGHINRRSCRHCSIDIQPRRVEAFTIVVVEVELDGHTVGDTAGPAVAQTLTRRPDRGRRAALNHERKPIGLRICATANQEAEVGRELLHVDSGVVPSTGRFPGKTVSQAQARAIQCGFAIEGHRTWCKSTSEIDDVAASRNGVGGAANGTLCIASSNRDGLDGLRDADCDWRGINGRIGRRSCAIRGVVDRCAARGVADRNRLRRIISAWSGAKCWGSGGLAGCAAGGKNPRLNVLNGSVSPGTSCKPNIALGVADGGGYIDLPACGEVCVGSGIGDGES